MQFTLCLVLLAACGSSAGSTTDAHAGKTGDGSQLVDGATGDSAVASGRTIFVIPMENSTFP